MDGSDIPPEAIEGIQTEAQFTQDVSSEKSKERQEKEARMVELMDKMEAGKAEKGQWFESVGEGDKKALILNILYQKPDLTLGDKTNRMIVVTRGGFVEVTAWDSKKSMLPTLSKASRGHVKLDTSSGYVDDGKLGKLVMRREENANEHHSEDEVVIMSPSEVPDGASQWATPFTGDINEVFHKAIELANPNADAGNINASDVVQKNLANDALTALT